MIDFRKWLLQQEMAVQHHFNFKNDEPPTDTARDSGGFRLMLRPAFRKSDRMLIVRDSANVEKWLNKATEQFGLHWIIGYVEPEADAKENDPESWAKYSARGAELGQKWVQDFAQSEKGKTAMPPASPANTIVYIKPTSRLHPMTSWQQVHNIAHAVWNFNQPQRKAFAAAIEKAVHELQQLAYESDPQSPPSEAEVTVVLARLLDNQMLQRILVMRPGELDNSVKLAKTAFQSYDELMYDLLASFLRNGGKLPLRPRGPGSIATMDRTTEIQPNPEIVSKKAVRNWVWKSLAADRGEWEKVAQGLTGICVEALQNCTWAKQNGPIYPYRKLVTLP